MLRDDGRFFLACRSVGLLEVDPSRQAEPPLAPVFPTATSVSRATPTPTGDADAVVKLYLPKLENTPVPVRAIPSGYVEQLYLEADTAAVVIGADRAYLAAGPRIIAYDISVPGRAKRLGISEMASGQIRHLALGDGLLFAMSRPLFDPNLEYAQRPDWEPTLSELPAWSVIDVFDLEDPDHPHKRGSLELREPWDFAVGLAAWGSYAYLPVISEFLDSDYSLDPRSRYENRANCETLSDERTSNCGFIAISAENPDAPALLSRFPELFYSSSGIVHQNRLHWGGSGG